MRYTCSNRSACSSWTETTLTNERAVVEYHVQKHIRIYDADECGEEEVYFAFSTGRFFRVTYTWWFEMPKWHFRGEVENMAAALEAFEAASGKRPLPEQARLLALRMPP